MKKFRQILEGTISSSEKTQTVQLESDAAYAASLKKIALDKQIASLSNRDRNTLTRIADMMKNANNDRKEDISENDMSLDDIKKKWAKEIIAFQDGDGDLPHAAEMDMFSYHGSDAIKTDDPDEFDDFVMGLRMGKYKKESVNEGTLNEKDISITMPFDGQPDNSLEADAQDEFDVTVDDYDEDEGTISVTGSREQIKKWLTSKGDIGFGYDDNQADKVLGDAEPGMTLDDVKKKYAKEIIAWQDDDRRISKRVIDAIRSMPGFDKNADAEDYAKGMKMGAFKKESVDEIWSPIKKAAGKIKAKVTGSNAPARKPHNPARDAFDSPSYLGARLKIAKQKLRDAQEKAKKAAADGNDKGMDHWNEVEMNRQADIEKLQKKISKKESIDENLRKDIAQMSAKFPEGSTVKLKNGKTGKVLGVTKDRVHVGIGDETSYHAPTAIEETTLAQQQRDKTKSQHDAHAKRMNTSARDSIKKYDQVKKDREKVSGVNEAIDAKDYKVDSEKSQFNDGHRGKVVHKEKGTTMYLGGMSWKTPDAAKGHANAYLMGYEIGGETGAKRAQDRYVDQNMDKRMSAKKESFKSYTEGAKEDALRAIKNDRDFKQVKDVDIRATTADMKLAKKNPIQQLRKISDYGKGQIEFLNNKKLKLTKKEADALLRGFDAMKKPQDKEKYQTMISKDSAGLKRILKIVNK
jgi:hypothetical protein